MKRNFRNRVPKKEPLTKEEQVAEMNNPDSTYGYYASQVVRNANRHNWRCMRHWARKAMKRCPDLGEKGR